MKDTFELIGQVKSGRGLSRERIRQHSEEFTALTGETLVNGSLNVLVKTPVQFVNANSLVFGSGSHLIWRARVAGIPVWIFRWRIAPLHVVEILSATHLRDALHLSDDEEIVIEACQEDIQRVSCIGRLGWNIFWLGRRDWYYKRPKYSYRAEYWSRLFGANQSGTFMTLVRAKYKRNAMLYKIRNLMFDMHRRRNEHSFERLPIDETGKSDLRVQGQVRNLLNYTKTSGTSYSAHTFPAGYHTIELNGELLRGQRDPATRLAAVPIDFEGKSVLDIGCNQGGMLFQLDQKIRWGIGIDYDHRMVNAASHVNGLRRSDRLGFYVFNLEKEPLDLINDFLPEAKVDVVFLLSVCMWLRNWREVLSFAAGISYSMLFETNGTAAQQAEQQAELAKLYRKVTQLTEVSEDDPGQRNRRLYYCELANDAQ